MCNKTETETEIERVKRRLNEAEYNRDFCIKQLIMAVEDVDKYKEILLTMHRTMAGRKWTS